MIQTERRELASLQRGRIKAGGKDEWINEKLTVPPLPPTNLRGCHLIRIQYDLFVSTGYKERGKVALVLVTQGRSESTFLLYPFSSLSAHAVWIRRSSFNSQFSSLRTHLETARYPRIDTPRFYRPIGLQTIPNQSLISSNKSVFRVINPLPTLSLEILIFSFYKYVGQFKLIQGDRLAVCMKAF